MKIMNFYQSIFQNNNLKIIKYLSLIILIFVLSFKANTEIPEKYKIESSLPKCKGTDYTKWTAEFNTSVGTAGAYLEVEYPLDGAGNIDRAQTILESKLENSSEIHSINGIVAAGGVGRTDIDPAGETAGIVTVRYACS